LTTTVFKIRLTTIDVNMARVTQPRPGPQRRKFKGALPEERTAHRRTQLVEAGLQAFGTEGFHAVGVRDVCAVAKLTERYFYESFRNREALFVAVYEAAAERLRGIIAAAVPASPKSVAELARAGLGAALAAFRDDPRLARILLIEVLAIGPELGDAHVLVSQGFTDQISEMTLALYPDLKERGLDARLVANGLYGATLYVTMRWATEGFREPLDRVLSHAVFFYEAFATELDGREPRSSVTRSSARRAATGSARRGPEPRRARRA
jgi:AcrR family transcriptional regulator